MDETRVAGYSPTIRKRSLSRQLVELRKACGLTTAAVAKRGGGGPRSTSPLGHH